MIKFPLFKKKTININTLMQYVAALDLDIMELLGDNANESIDILYQVINTHQVHYKLKTGPIELYSDYIMLSTPEIIPELSRELVPIMRSNLTGENIAFSITDRGEEVVICRTFVDPKIDKSNADYYNGKQLICIGLIVRRIMETYGETRINKWVQGLITAIIGTAISCDGSFLKLNQSLTIFRDTGCISYILPNANTKISTIATTYDGDKPIITKGQYDRYMLDLMLTNYIDATEKEKEDYMSNHLHSMATLFTGFVFKKTIWFVTLDRKKRPFPTKRPGQVVDKYEYLRLSVYPKHEMNIDSVDRNPEITELEELFAEVKRIVSK